MNIRAAWTINFRFAIREIIKFLSSVIDDENNKTRLRTLVKNAKERRLNDADDLPHSFPCDNLCINVSASSVISLLCVNEELAKILRYHIIAESLKSVKNSDFTYETLPVASVDEVTKVHSYKYSVLGNNRYLNLYICSFETAFQREYFANIIKADVKFNSSDIILSTV
jgi:uncharacterized surface protein with fasciclin (FAS1) repeats